MLRYPHLRNLLVAALVSVAIFPLLSIFLIHPTFTHFLISGKASDSVLVAEHLAHYLTHAMGESNEVEKALPVLKEEADHHLKEFKLYKFRFFSPSGRIMLSSNEKEVGNVNEKPYFRGVVEEKKVLSMTVEKEGISQEGVPMRLDVVETYVPVMREGQVIGVFEIYWDITARKAGLDRLLANGATGLFGTASVLLGIILLMLRRHYHALEGRETAEAAVRESRERLSAILRTALDPFLLMDDKGTILDCNPATEKLFGFSAEQLVGRSLSDTLVPPEVMGKRQWNDSLRLFTHEGPLVNRRIELEGRCADDSRVSLELSASVIRAGNRTLITAFLRDITERKQLIESLRDTLTAAQEANRAKSVFLANMSHEIRTPLNAIIGVADLLKESPLNPEQMELVDLYANAGENLMALINDVLDLSKIEAGELILEEAPFSLKEVVEGSVRLFSGSARTKGLALTTEWGVGLPETVVGDENRLRQILLNLIGNALKFTPKGEITVRVNWPGRRFEEGNLLFSVCDTGIGVPKEKRSAIFAPFVQADLSTTRRYGGTGLGLAICARLVERMGGSIGLRDGPKGGSEFHFTARLGAFREQGCEQAVTTAPLLQTRRETTRPLRILLVDDAAEARLLIQAFLKQEPHHVEVAENGQEGLERLKNGHYDLVFMDMQMPVMDGYTATTLYREWEKSRPGIKSSQRSPIIALTANAMREDAQRIEAVGCDLHLTKPLKKKRLLEVLSRFA